MNQDPVDIKLAPGPRPVRSLHLRRSDLADPGRQLELLANLELETAAGEQADFERTIAAHGGAVLRPSELEYFQINLGKLCNMSCRHCHVDAGPERSDQVMDRPTVLACLRALDRTAAHTVDLTGGAPEMNPHFRFLVDELVRRGKRIIDRCNLTILLAPGYDDLPEWLADRQVEIVCSLPHYRPRNTDAQRGNGAFTRSLAALKRLNEVGYGQGDPARKLTLMTNPAGAFLAGNQTALEPEWQRALARDHAVTFDHLIALNNMPIARFLEWLQSTDNLDRYMERLVNSFNPATVPGLMCRNTISISWDGKIYDCDFNQMLDLEAGDSHGRVITLDDGDAARLGDRRIRTARHCFGCTAGAGSSCGGALTADADTAAT